MRLILLLLLLLSIPLPVLGATVSRVIDADTLVLDDALKVRLYGVDCPERGQPGEKEATEYAVQLVLGQRVEIEEQYQDRYNRIVAIVILESGFSLQELLLRDGAAWVAPRYCKRPECDGWHDLEQSARRSRVGIWRDEHAVPPWEWRMKNRDSRGLQ